MPPKSPRKRLDLALVERGLADSRQKAQAMILAGEVQIDGARADKAGQPVAQSALIEVHSRLQKYASRGGFKLEGALLDFSISVQEKICLDVGSSNGGFTDCLLQNGAARVYAVDVNIAQLAWKLREDPRVIAIQKNARALVPSDLPELVALVAIDVSFISVTKVLPAALACATSGAHLLILVKPQFELQREEVSRGGIVRDPALHEKAIATVRLAAESLALLDLRVFPSHLPGAEGNQEYFLHAVKPPAVESL
jgi:23S rRNA (cytidine1920-2'-O)/16S rRNA (cytidine1409-2'-O)-methyltransferase